MEKFKGSERRRHRLVVTRNTEYHLRDGVVVAVRDRQSKRWCEGHLAIDLRMQGGVRFFDNGAVIPSLDRPAKRDVLAYATLGVRKTPSTKKASAARAMS